MSSGDDACFQRLRQRRRRRCDLLFCPFFILLLLTSTARALSLSLAKGSSPGRPRDPLASHSSLLREAEKGSLGGCELSQKELDKVSVPATAPAKSSSSATAAAEEEAPPVDVFARDASLWPEDRSSLEVAIDKAKDTLADLAVIARRTFAPTTPQVRTSRRQKNASSPTRLKAQKPVLLVLGSGWGSHALSKIVDTEIWDVIIVSPTNHFTFTPMLPSAAVGTVEFRSVLEPVRVSNPTVTYLEAEADEVDLEKKVARCTAAVLEGEQETGEPRQRFEIAYDVVIFALGEQSATFGVPGVRENAYFLKTINDARRLRTRVGRLFEAASLPSTSEEERKRLLSFVVVGGGPTGVEFAGTLADYVRVDLARKFPSLEPTVTLLQSDKAILNSFSTSLQERALAALRSEGIDVKLGVRVMEVTDSYVAFRDKSDPSNTERRLPAGMVLWSAGNSSRPLVRDLVQRFPPQQPYSVKNPVVAKIAVDPYLRVIGTRDALAIGDCSVMTGRRLPATAQVAGQQGAYVARLLNRGNRIGWGGVGPGAVPPMAPGVPAGKVAKSWSEALQSMDRPAAMTTESDEEEDARSRRSSSGGTRAGRAVAASLWLPRLLGGEAREDSEALLRDARKEAGLASLDDSESSRVSSSSPPPPKPFEFLSLGILAYVGSDKGVSDVAIPGVGETVKVSGYLSFLLWRSVYITKQVSTRNRVLILLNWTMTRIFGRDLSLF